MGMTIEEHKEHLLDIMDSMPDDACGDWRDSLAYAIDTMRKYQKIQADYNARLKADLVAILTEIQLEIEEQVLESLSDGGDDWSTAEKVNECLDIIDKYKAESEG